MQSTKNLLKYIPVFAITLFTNCQENNKTKNAQEEEPLQKTNPVVEAPSNIISLEQADAIYTNYSKHRIPMIENYETKERAPSAQFEAARFVDFDYETLKNYLDYVDQEAANAGVKKVTKLRMYFANYPDESTFKDGKNVVHPRQNSLFLLPTLEKDGGDYSFYIGDDGEPKLVIDWKDSELEKSMGAINEKTQTARASLAPNFFSTSNSYSSKSLILNRGGSGPPPRTEF